MAEIDDEIAALREAVVLGARRVVTQTNGVRKEIEFPSFQDLKARLEWLEDQKLGAKRPRVILASF